MWSCSAYSTLINNIISQTKDLLLTDLKKHSNPNSYYDTLPELLCFFDELFAPPSSSTDGFLNVIQCLIPTEFISLIHKITKNKNSCYTTIVNSLTFFFKNLYDIVWKHRCKLLIAYELSKGINKHIKCKQGACKRLPHSLKKPSSLIWESWIYKAIKYGNS